jgi:hypothetical protein
MGHDPRADGPDAEDPEAIAGRQAPAQRRPVRPGNDASAPAADTPSADDAPSAEAVAAFLAARPDFLADHPDLLDTLILPEAGGGDGVVDLRAHLVQRQRDEIDRLKRQQRAIVSATRANQNTQQRIHSAILFLLDAESFEHLIQAIGTDLAVLLDLDAAVLSVENEGDDRPPPLRSGVRVLPPGTIDHLLGGAAHRLDGEIEGDETVFGPAAGLVKSQALIRLDVSSETPPALLALGSRDPEMFQNGMRTDLMGFLANVLQRCIRDWLDLPR